MWWLRKDDGFSLVLVGILLVLLLAFAGFAIDVGAMYQERRELRNGADAAALAIGQACAENPGDPQCSDDTGSDSLAQDYANFNAHDEHSGVDSVVIDTSPPDPYLMTVRVVTSAQDATGDPGLGLRFLRLFGRQSVDVRANATAALGYPREAQTPPVIFSECEYGSAYPGGPPTYPNVGNSNPVVLRLLQGSVEEWPECPTGPGGQDLPGGFGFVGDSNDGICEVQVLAGTAYADVGADVPRDCQGPQGNRGQLLFDTLIGNGAIPVPIFEQVTERPKSYQVAGFAFFRVIAYDLGNKTFTYPKAADHDPTFPGGYDCPDNPETPGPDPEDRCIYGYFTTGVIPVGEFGGGYFGAILVRLID